MHIHEYKFLRGLELEHRHPNDVGGWLTTIMRLELGEGIPPADAVAKFSLVGADGRLAPAPKFKPGEVPMVRTDHYQRVIGSKHVTRWLKLDCDVATCVYLFPWWGKPDKGYIRLPNIGEEPLEVTHNVRVIRSYPGVKQFKFDNWWGPNWGQQGKGVFDYAYMDHYCFDSWAPFVKPPAMPVERHVGNVIVYKWTFPDVMGNLNHGFGYERQDDKSRLAWTFIVEREGALNVEELYVWEAFRGNGLGRRLARAIKRLARERNLPIRLFVPFSDAKRESLWSYLAMVATVNRLGLRFHRCPVPWAAYYATNELSGGAEEPIEPVVFPSRPKSTLQAVLMAATMTISPDTKPQVEVVRSQIEQRLPVNKVVQHLEEQDLRTINRRRSRLIWKRYKDGNLSEPEAAELDRLQKASLRLGLEHQPPSKISPDQLAYLESKLASP
jgi:GNAT superfamily N-acetyltransferase